MMRMRKKVMIRKKSLYLLIMLTLIAGAAPAGADETEGPETPDENYDTYIQTIHIGQTHVWKPYADYPDLPVTYSCDDEEIAVIAQDGTITPVGEGAASVSASTPRTDAYEAGEASMYFYVLPGEDGLYLTDMASHFYYKGEQYQPGGLPLETEIDLCRTQSDLKKYIDDFLLPARSELEPDEAALSAILNFGAQYFSKNSAFEDFGSSCETGKEDWMQLLRRKRGLCAYNASLFCWLMHLGGLPAMQVDSPLTESRAHSWNLIEHDGYYYSLEEYHFLHEPWERYVIPPLSVKTAEYFAGNIIGPYAVHFPKSGILDDTMKLEDLGRDLSGACPVLMYERGKDGTYRVWFDEIREGHIPAWSDGTPVKPEEVVYRNMETDPIGGQYNEEAKPLFDEANALLWEEISHLMD